MNNKKRHYPRRRRSYAKQKPVIVNLQDPNHLSWYFSPIPTGKIFINN